MNHSFNIDIARNVGVNSAIMLENLAYWILKNKSENKNFYKNKNWTYCSVQGLTMYFPYLTARQIQHSLNKLLEQGYIEKDNFNKSPYDKTSWYTLTEKTLNTSVYRLDKFVKSKQHQCQSNTIYNNNIKNLTPNPLGEEDLFINLSFKNDDKFKEAWKQWTDHTKEIKKKISKTQLKALSEAFNHWGVDRTIKNIKKSVLRGYSSIIDLYEQTNKEEITLETLKKAYKWQINADNYSFNDLSIEDKKILKSISIEEFKTRCVDFEYIYNELKNKTSKLSKIARG